MNEFPDYHIWIEVLGRRDQGVILLALAVLFGVAWLINGRFYWPKLLPIIRAAVIVGFYFSFALLVFMRR